MDDFLQLLATHQWLAVSALVIGAIVRLLKGDTPLPLFVPPSLRAWLALGLGVASGVLDALQHGTPWLTALMGGLAAALTAISGHELMIEGLRSGRELFEKKAVAA